MNNATGLPGVDSEVTWSITPRSSAPFDSLRIGAPSGITSVFGAVVDNIVLERVQPIPEPAALSLAGIAILTLRRRRCRA
jgi:MYXO-CTERM domain-containing protein